MIVLGEKHGDVNVIHLIVGQESDFQLNFSGHIVVDMTENINFQPGEKVLIIFNKCESEELLRQQIQFFKQANSQEDSDSQKSDVEKKPSRGTKTSIPSSNKRIYNKELRCPKCSSWGTFVQDGKISMCKTCAQIEEGLKSKDIPTHPDKSEKNQIFNKLLEDSEFKSFLSDVFLKSKTDDSNNET